MAYIYLLFTCYGFISLFYSFYFFFHDTATTEIYTYGHTLSLHDALPISFSSNSVAASRASMHCCAIAGSAKPHSGRVIRPPALRWAGINDYNGAEIGRAHV